MNTQVTDTTDELDEDLEQNQSQDEARYPSDDELANMSDDEVMNLVEPPVGSMQELSSGKSESEDEEEDTSEGEREGAAEGSAKTDGDAGDQGKKGEDPADDLAAGAPSPLGSDDKNPSPSSEKSKNKTKEGEPKGDTKLTSESTTPVDYKAVYEKIMAPFKANGRQIQLNSPDEVISLMQMGANYTQKMQALQPNLKLMRMLENNGLLDESKLTFLIDVNRKDPAAITKLLKEANIDPLEIDVQADPGYKPGNHRVTDEDMVFVDTIREVNTSPEGAKLIREIDQSWDEASRKAIWKEPGILKVLRDHRENGIYSRVESELERRKLFGEFQNTPFLEAYYATAQALHSQGKLMTPNGAPTQNQNPAQGAQPAPVQSGQRQGRVLDQKAAVRKPSPDVDKIRAAQPTRAAPGKVQSDFNPLAMSDEEFEKSAQMAMKL